MANYYGAVRTNYFHVKDEAQFRALMAKAAGDEDGIYLWDDERDKEGNQVFGFGVYGGISGIPDDEGEFDDDSYDRFINGLQACVADDDAILIYEAGHEKLRYVIGSVLVITSKACEYLDLQGVGCEKARQLLGNDQWSTKSDY